MPKKGNTRSAQGSGTIRQRKAGRWEARYTVGRDPGTGKQVQKSVYGSTQREVRKALSEAVAALDSGNYFEPSKMTVARWVEIWLQEYMGDKKYLTVKHYNDQGVGLHYDHKAVKFEDGKLIAESTKDGSALALEADVFGWQT